MKYSINDYRKSSVKRNKQHALRLECLEAREMLSVNPLTPADELAQVPALVASESNPVADVTLAEVPQSQVAGLPEPMKADEAPIVLQHGDYYSLEYQISDTRWVYVNGLSQSDVTKFMRNFNGSNRQSISGDYTDAEKRQRGLDVNMCWAGAVSNSLWYTGWANENIAQNDNGSAKFQSEDDVFFEYINHFSNEGGETLYTAEWFITGRYRPDEWGGYSGTTVDVAGGGGYHTGQNYSDISGQLGIMGDNRENMETLTDKLRENAGVTLSVTWATGGHLISCWGYVYDTAFETTDANYYSALLITDPDDSRFLGENAANRLRTNQIFWGGDRYYFNDYDVINGNTYVSKFTWLDAYESKIDLSTSDTATPSDEFIIPGEKVTVRNIPVSCSNEAASGTYSIQVFAQRLNSTETPILLGTIQGTALDAGESMNYDFEFDSRVLGYAEEYSISWKILSGSDINLDNNGGACTTTLKTQPKKLDMPGLSLEVLGKTDIQVKIRAVTGASGYVIQYSDKADFSEYQTINSTLPGALTVSHLTPDTQYYFRAYAIGEGKYQNSDMSFVVSKRTDPYTFDLQTENSGVLSMQAMYPGEIVTLSGVKVYNSGDRVSEKYSITYYASSNKYITTTDTPLATEEHSALAPEAVEYLSVDLDTSSLTVGRAYYIGWILTVQGETSSTNNAGYVPTPLNMVKIPLEVPTFSISCEESGALKVHIGAVENADRYVVEYATTSDFLRPTYVPFSEAGEHTIENLEPNHSYYLRVYAVGSGIYQTSVKSDVQCVMPTTDHLAVPGNFRVEASQANAVSLSWDEVAGADAYVISYRQYGSSDWETEIVANNSAVVNGLLGDTVYQFQIRAERHDAGGHIAASSNSTALLSVRTLLAVGAPADFQIKEVGTKFVVLSWDEVDGVSNYRISYRAEGSSTWRTISTTQLERKISGLKEGVTYEFYIQSVVGRSRSEASEILTATTKKTLTNPLGLKSTAKTATSVSLKWNAVPNTNSYRVLYKATTVVPWQEFEVTGTTATIDGLIPNKTFMFRVISIPSSEAYAESASVRTIYVKTTALPKLATPKGLKGSNISFDSLTLSWNAVSGAASYEIYYRPSSSSVYKSVTTTGTSYDFGGLQSYKNYRFYVVALPEVGSSEYVMSANSTIITLRTLRMI